MVEIRQTEEFREWVNGLRDATARARIAVRAERIARPYGGREAGWRRRLRTAHRPTAQGIGSISCSVAMCWWILLCGGDKSTQPKDIARAKALAKDLED